MAPKSKLTVQNRSGITNSPVERLAMRYLIEIENPNPRIQQSVEQGEANLGRIRDPKRYTRVERIRARDEAIARRKRIQELNSPPKRKGLKDFTGRDRKFMANYREMKLQRFRQIREAGEKLLNFLTTTDKCTGDVRTDIQFSPNQTIQEYPDTTIRFD